MPDAAVAAPKNALEVTVSELSARLKRTVEDAYGYVRVRGEISGFRGVHGSGHCYFALKDEAAKIDAVIWKSAMPRLRFKPQEGLEVIAVGRLTTYPGKSTYQLIIESLEPAGIGALMALLDQRRRTLAAEGIFDLARKRRLPYLPEIIGVITSPTGAVIRDILHRLEDRFPRRVIIWPVRVQGETCAAEVAAAIAGFNALPVGGPIPRPDLLIVARGGGSLEDLWGFNEEIIVRAAAASTIPLISAIGHETDTTLIDLVADVRAPTPTAAAEMAVPVRSELAALLRDHGTRLASCTQRGAERRRHELRALGRALPAGDRLLALPRQRTDFAGLRLAPALSNYLHAVRGRANRTAPDPSKLRLRLHAGHRLTTLMETRLERAAGQLGGRLRARLDRCAFRLAPALNADIRAHRTRLDALLRRDLGLPALEALRRNRTLLTEFGGQQRRCIRRGMERNAERLAGLLALVDALSYRNVLRRGYALVRDASDRPISAASAVPPDAPLQLEFADGRVRVIADGARRSVRTARPKPGQGSLFE